MAEFTAEQEAYLTSLEKTKVDPKTNQPVGVPEFKPTGVSGYDPQSGEVAPSSSSLADKATAFTTGMNDLPVVGPLTKAGVAGGAALATKGIDSLTGGPDTSIADRYDANRARQESSMAENPNSALAGNLLGSVVAGSGIPNPETMLGAAGLGGGIGAADTASRAAARGEMPTLSDTAASAASGAAGGALFHGIGRAASDVLTTFGLEGKPLSKIAQTAIAQRNKIENEQGAAMDASGVIIGKKSINKLSNDIFKELADEGFSRQTSKSLYPVVKMLNQEAAKGVDISLREFNNLRQRIRDGLPAGVSGTERNWQGLVLDQMNNLIETLPRHNIRGDANAGLEAWRNMNVVTQDKRRADILADMFYRAGIEASKRGRGKSLGQAMQDEAANFLTAKGKAAERAQSLFDGPQKKVLENLVKGTVGTAWNNLQERLLGQSIVYNLALRGPIRAGTYVGEKLLGGGEAATRKMALDLLESTGQNTEALGGGNISRSKVNLTGAGALLATKIAQQHEDYQARIDSLLNAERFKAVAQKEQQFGGQQQQPQQTPQPMQSVGQGQQQGFPQSRVVPQQ